MRSERGVVVNFIPAGDMTRRIIRNSNDKMLDSVGPQFYDDVSSMPAHRSSSYTDLSKFVGYCLQML